MVTVRLYASLKDLAGRPELQVPLSRPAPVKALWSQLEQQIPQVMAWVKDRKVLVAVNQEMATDETVIHDGDEVGLMPPFSGGGSVRRSARAAQSRPAALTAGRPPWTRIQAEDFSVDEELRRIKSVSSRIGGVAVFIGTARDFSQGRSVRRLDYEHFAGLAERKLADIRARALKQFDVIEVNIIHRTGEVPVGGNIVLVVAAAEHRAEAFRACRWCIDELKSTAPIWKKETTPEGEIWVEEHP